MNPLVVIGVCSGIANEATVFFDPKLADKEIRRLKKEYGIRKGHEAESEHSVECFEFELVGLTAEQCLHLLDDSIGRDQYAVAVWHIEDVESLAQERDKKLTKKQAKEVIKRVDKHQDAEFGISWDTLDTWIDIVLAEAKAGRKVK